MLGSEFVLPVVLWRVSCAADRAATVAIVIAKHSGQSDKDRYVKTYFQDISVMYQSWWVISPQDSHCSGSALDI